MKKGVKMNQNGLEMNRRNEHAKLRGNELKMNSGNEPEMNRKNEP